MGRSFRTIVLLFALFAVPLPALAQDYPTRTITIIIGYAPGGGADIPARYFARKLAPMAGKPVIVENRQGALTNIAAEAVARAKPDGHTLFITSGNSTMASNPHLFKDLTWDPVRDFTPVTTLYQIPFVLLVNPRTPADSVSALTAYLKNKKDKANYGYSGTLGLACAELYKGIAGLQTTGIAYKNPLQSIPDLVSGTLDFIIQDATNSLAQMRSGKLTALAVTTQRRSSLMPDLPTMDESGLAGYDLSGWFAAYLPANSPPAVVEKLHGWFNQILATEETRKFLANMGSEPFLGSPQSLAQYQAREFAKWGRLIREANIQVQ